MDSRFSIDFRPKLFSTLKSYNKTQFSKDLMAGIIVGIVAIPLAIAFGIASGVGPTEGLVTAIIAGLLISVFGGSKVQIGGPTGAFIVIIYGIIQEFGVNSMSRADTILKNLRPNLTKSDLFWARHLYWSMVFYSVVCQQLLLARTKEKKYTQEFIDTYALRMTHSYCSRFDLPAPDGKESWVYDDIEE